MYLIKKTFYSIIIFILIWYLIPFLVLKIEFLNQIYNKDELLFYGVIQLVISFFLILYLSGGQIAKYGFKYGLFKFDWVFYCFIVFIFFVVISKMLNIADGNAPYFGDYKSIWKEILISSMFKPVAEEFFFRGLIQSYIAESLKDKRSLIKYNIYIPIICSVLFFGITHLQLTFYMSMGSIIGFSLKILFLGFVFAYFREKSGSLYPSILAHVIHNLVTVF